MDTKIYVRTIKGIAKQLKTDRETDQLTLFDPRDPFMGGK